MSFRFMFVQCLYFRMKKGKVFNKNLRLLRRDDTKRSRF